MRINKTHSIKVIAAAQIAPGRVWAVVQSGPAFAAIFTHSPRTRGRWVQPGDPRLPVMRMCGLARLLSPTRAVALARAIVRRRGGHITADGAAIVAALQARAAAAAVVAKAAREAGAKAAEAPPVRPSETKPTQAKPAEAPFDDGPAPSDGKRYVLVYNRRAAAVACEGVRGGGADSDARGRLVSLYKKLRDRGGWRELRTPGDDWRTQLARLRADFPNFEPVFSYYDAMATLAERAGARPVFEPLLLHGPPGVGKSVIAESLADIFAGGYRRIAMATAQTSAVLCGGDKFWSNTQPGAIFNAIAEGATANPMLLLDEIDKAGGRADYDPLGPLYELLEPAQARAFCDQSAPDVQLDASLIVWIATSNSLSTIPEPILQRFNVCEVDAPTREQMRNVVLSVDRRLRELRRETLAGMDIGDGVVDALLGMSPREVRKALMTGYGNAAKAGRWIVRPADLPRPAVSARRAAGFY